MGGRENPLILNLRMPNFVRSFLLPSIFSKREKERKMGGKKDSFSLVVGARVGSETNSLKLERSLRIVSVILHWALFTSKYVLCLHSRINKDQVS